MSLYFTLLFGLLMSEMAFLVFIVLPLPNKIRKLVYRIWNKIISKQEYMTIGCILWVIVGLLFVDSFKRANIPINLPGHPSGGSENLDTLKSSDPVTSIQVFATRAYNQRNVYISGFILYFMIVIPSIMTLIKRLIKYQDLLDKKNKIQDKEERQNLITGDKDLDELRNQLRQRNTSLIGLQKQVSNFEKHFDESVKADLKNEDPLLKKTE